MARSRVFDRTMSQIRGICELPMRAGRQQLCSLNSTSGIATTYRSGEVPELGTASGLASCQALLLAGLQRV